MPENTCNSCSRAFSGSVLNSTSCTGINDLKELFVAATASIRTLVQSRVLNRSTVFCA